MTSAGAPCDQAGINAGSCGPCYIFEGFSCSYGAPCPSDESLHSTFSTELVDELGFKWTTWEPGKTRGWDCMDSPCIATGMTLSPQGESRDDGGIPTAICKCRRPAALRDQYVYLQVNSCSVDLASASWSTAPDPLGAHEGNFCSENSAD